jgi:cytoskeletal protein RodZ
LTAPITEFGLHLKQARENRGISLRQIAAATKISTGALEALERGDFSRLPGGIFSRAFVRAYAVEVGLDADETVLRYTELSEAAARSAAAAPAQAEITDEDRAFLERQQQAAVWLKVAVAVLVIAIGGALWWWWMSKRAEAAPSVPSSATTTAAAPPSADPPAPASAAPASDTPVNPPVEPAATPPAAPDSARALAIALTMTDSCWTQVTADGRLIVARTMASGETQSIQADREVVIDVGNAGAVTWTINGRPGKPIGAAGEVKHLVLTKANATDFVR